MFRKLRIVSQISFFVIFIFLFFVLTRHPQGYSFSSEWFLWLNPLVALLSSVASRRIIVPLVFWGAAVALLSAIFGRFFCGFICPLGSIIDVTDAVFKKTRTTRQRPPVFLQRTKYMLLIALGVLVIFRSLSPLFMDPISITTRIFALLINPLIALTAIDLIHIIEPVLRAAGAEHLAMTSLRTPLYYGSIVTASLLLLILVGTIWDRRFWCQYVCPSGAFFGLLGKIAPFRRVVSKSTCSSCAVCARICPTRAINEKHIELTDSSECIMCGLCVSVKKNCNSFAFEFPIASRFVSADLRRRHVLASVAGGLLIVPALRAPAAGRRDETGRLIRPPGAIPESEFSTRCVACGACMKACPTNSIQPCMFGDGFHRVYTPKIVPRIAGCEEKCNLCGYVCPTGAIRKLTHDEKQFAKIGTAVIDRHRCLAWEQNKECCVCDEVCPYNAIEPQMIETTTGLFKVPVINEELCIGCGMCEQHCPIFDTAAIVIYKFGENRRSSGPYLSDPQKKRMLEARKKSDQSLYSRSHLSGSHTEFAAPIQPTFEGFDLGAEESGLPPGFE